MKLSMETVYFPEATFTQQKEMMADWTHTSDIASKLSFICAASAAVTFLSLLSFKDEYFYIYAGCVALFLIGGFLCKKWMYTGYISVFAGLFLSFVRFSLDKEMTYYIAGATIIQAVLSLACSYFAFRCAYNFNCVFKELQKCKGFPNFIANTADLYGEKIYLQDEESTVYESRKEASYNPFNSTEDVKSEEFRREQDLTAKALGEPIRMDFGADGQIIERKAQPKGKPYRYGRTIFGREITFLHNDVATSSFDEKRELMYKWRSNIEMTTKNFPLFVLLVMVAVMASAFGSIMGILNHAVVVVFVIGFNQMKMGKWYAPLTLLAATIYLLGTTTSDISVLCIIGAFVFNIGMIPGVIRYVLNYRLYKELSHQVGFPTFIRTTADLYADKMYIVEKTPYELKKASVKKPVKVMDIGYDNKPKKDDGAWNAFDYMDKNKEENNENES